MEFGELKNRPVVSLADASKLGFVDTALVDLHNQQVTGFRIRTGGIFTHHHAILLQDVKSLGQDAVTIEDSRRLTDEGKMPQLKTSVPLTNVVGSRVISEDGKEIGTVADIEMTVETGQIENYILAGKLMDRLRHDKHMIPSSAVKSIGDKLIVVTNQTVVA